MERKCQVSCNKKCGAIGVSQGPLFDTSGQSQPALRNLRRARTYSGEMKNGGATQHFACTLTEGWSRVYGRRSIRILLITDGFQQRWASQPVLLLHMQPMLCSRLQVIKITMKADILHAFPRIHVRILIRRQTDSSIK